jgi:hypothetical protein
VKNLSRHLFGPELCWMLLCGATMLLRTTNQPPTLAGNQRLELIGWFLPLIGIVLSLGTFAWLPGNKWLALGRVLVSGLVGVGVVTTLLCGAIRYDDSRNSGVGTAWMVFIMLGWIALGGAAVIAAIVIGVTSRTRRLG